MAPERGSRTPVRGCLVLALAVAVFVYCQPSSWTFGVPQGSAGSPLGLQPSLTGRIGSRRETGRLRVAAEEETVEKATPAASDAQLSSVSQSTVNLVKNIVGAGMLSLPAGVAAFSASPKALIPALSLTLFFGVLSAYGFVLIADACNRTGENTYQDTWAKAVGKRTAFIPLLACMAKAIIGVVCFTMILGDCFSLILSQYSLPAFLASRTSVILMLTAFILYPLCNMKSLAPLAKFSVVGVLSNVYIAAFTIFRAFDGTYKKGGALLQHAPIAPKFMHVAGSPWATVADPGLAVLLSILSTAFLAHYNAPLFYEQLAPSPSGEKSKRFFLVSLMGFSGAALFFMIVMAGGYMTFGQSSMGLILNNYAANDPFAGLARGAIGLSLITAYPLVFFSLRKLVVTSMGQKGDELMASKPKLFTAVLMVLITLVALKLRDLGKLAAFAGACFGSFLIYVAPAMMVIGAQRKGLGPPCQGAAGWANRIMQCSLIPLGLVLGVIGSIQSLK